MAPGDGGHGDPVGDLPLLREVREAPRRLREERPPRAAELREDGPPRARGLDEGVVRLISEKKNEPAWLLEWRLKALHRFLELAENHTEPTWAKVHYPPIDYQAISYYSAPKPKKQRST